MCRRVYSPVSFPKKYDAKGEFVRHYLPVLARYPAKYIYEPWKAPLSVQRDAGCIIGEDYPAPIVDHESVKPRNMEWMRAAYEANKAYGKRSPSTANSSKAKRHRPT